jgi:hypothetical protein
MDYTYAVENALRAGFVEWLQFWYSLMPEEVQNVVYDAVLGADDDIMGL